MLHGCPGIPVNQLPGLLHLHTSVTLLTNVLKNSFGMILKVFLTKQEKIMAWSEYKPERQVMFCYNKTSQLHLKTCSCALFMWSTTRGSFIAY